MKKSDVLRSYHQGHRGDPMINVKHHLWVPDLIRRWADTGHEFSGDAGFWAWIDECWSGDTDVFNGPVEWARESCWEAASDLAHEIWPTYSIEMVDEKKFFAEYPPGSQYRFTGNKVPRKRYHVQVHSAGRQGGWLVVTGLPDIDGWDAIAVGQWSRFERSVRDIVDNEYPYQFIWQLHVHAWEPAREERRNLYPAPNYAGATA